MIVSMMILLLLLLLLQNGTRSSFAQSASRVDALCRCGDGIWAILCGRIGLVRLRCVLRDSQRDGKDEEEERSLWHFFTFFCSLAKKRSNGRERENSGFSSFFLKCARAVSVRQKKCRPLGVFVPSSKK
jgi:hypothetical protein